MRKGRLLLFMFTCALLLIASDVIAATDIPDQIVINSKGYKKDIKGPVIFKHAKHARDLKIACTTCHHEYKDGKNVWVEGQKVKKCEECHNPLKSEGNVKKLMIAFHNECQNCHKKERAEGKKAPDKKCENCHQAKPKPSEETQK